MIGASKIYDPSQMPGKSLRAPQLREKIQQLLQEQEILKGSFLTVIDGKDKEINLCHKMLEQQTNNHQNAFQTLSNQISQMKQEFLK